MGNSLYSNPVSIDAAASSTLSGIRQIQLIQWIDDAGDIGNDDDLSFTLNGVTIAVKPQRHETAASVDAGGVVFQAGPFAKPILADSFVVNTLDHGIVLVWLA